MRASHSTPWVFSMLLALAACSSVPAAPSSRSDGLIGEEAYLSGNYALADFYLNRAITNGPSQFVSSQSVNRWEEVVANTYWEAGWDKKLLIFTKARLPGAEAAFWKCRVDEREGRAIDASDCYLAQGDITRSQRALREEIMKDVISDHDYFAIPNGAEPGKE